MSSKISGALQSATQNWFSVGEANAIALDCAHCGCRIDLQYPSIDHHPACCRSCGVECVYIPWRDQTAQIVIANAPEALVKAIWLLQAHLNELEFVDLIVALEEAGDHVSASNCNK